MDMRNKEEKLQESLSLLEKAKTRAYDLIRIKEITLEDLKGTNQEIIRLETLINDLKKDIEKESGDNKEE